MNFEEVIYELYRLAETKQWEGKKTEEALTAAIDGMEKIWELQQTDKRKSAMVKACRKQPRIWS